MNTCITIVKKCCCVIRTFKVIIHIKLSLIQKAINVNTLHLYASGPGAKFGTVMVLWFTWCL